MRCNRGKRRGWLRVMPSWEEFRNHAEECRRLAACLRKPEHQCFALDLAKAWIALAEYEERKRVSADQSTRIVAQSAP